MMVEFIGRTEELGILKELYDSDRSLACAICGRHGVGKTELLRRFCEDKRHLILTCIGGTVNRSLEAFTDQMDDMIPNCPQIRDFGHLFSLLPLLKNKRRTVVVIDNFHEMTSLDDSVVLILRDFLSKTIHDLNMFLIVCNSSIKETMSQTEDRMMPLCGRFTTVIKLRPLPYRDARLFHGDMTEADRIRMYCIAGGMPAYHLLLQESTAKENIQRHILGPRSFFRSMIGNSLNEMTPSQSAGRIMSVLSDGPASLKELSDETGFTGAAVMKTMDNLIQMEVVRKERAIGGKRDPMYRLTDGPLLFYHRLIQPNMPSAEDEDTELSYLMLEDEMEMSYRPLFEEICKQYILKNYYCLEIGRWWDKTVVDGDTVQDDVDIVARVLIGKEESTLLCECGFYDRPTKMSDLEELRYSGERIRDIGNTRYVLFSRSGFTDELRTYAEEFPTERIELVDISALH